jgi:hypothetical protein
MAHSPYVVNVGHEVLQALNIPAENVRSLTIELGVNDAAVVVLRTFLEKDHLKGVVERLSKERWVLVTDKP